MGGRRQDVTRGLESDGAGHRRVLVIQHDVDSPPALLDAAAADARLDLDVRVVPDGAEIPEDLGDAAGLVVLGGSAGVRDASEQPYLYRVMELIRVASRADRPYLGVCLGGQLAASALGGGIHEGESGFEIGWVEVRPTPAGRRDPVTSTVGDGLPLFQWHRDVIDPPPGAVPLLSGGRYGQQGFRLGRAWGFQAHPEIDGATIAAWADSPAGRAELRSSGVSRDPLFEALEVRTAGARRILDAWCRIAAGSVR